jgi:hypothetical protein
LFEKHKTVEALPHMVKEVSGSRALMRQAIAETCRNYLTSQVRRDRAEVWHGNGIARPERRASRPQSSNGELRERHAAGVRAHGMYRLRNFPIAIDRRTFIALEIPTKLRIDTAISSFPNTNAQVYISGVPRWIF